MWQARQHQKRVVPLMTQGNIILVWEPGAGKTYPVLAASYFIDGPLLVIVPAALREQWRRSAREHAPLKRVAVLEKTKEKITADTFASHDIFICSYEYACELNRWRQLRQHKWGAVAVDECHYITNLDADRTRALLGLKADEKQGLVFAGKYAWFLSGTPFTFPNQIYPILRRLFPESTRRDPRDGPGYMTEREWENAFCVVADKGDGFGVKIVGARNIPELRDRLGPVLDKVRLADVFDMPPLTVDMIPIKADLRKLLHGLDPELLAAHEYLMDILNDGDIADGEKLAQIEASGLVMAQLRHAIAVTKVQATSEIIRNELFTGTKKLLIFGWHREPIKTLAKGLKADFLVGGMGDKARTAVIDRFINDPESRVLAGQIGAMGTGTDGLQTVCHRSLFMEASWAYRDNKQSLHRTYRAGQQSPCHTSFLTLVGSVDEYVSSVLKRNAEIVSKLLD